MNKYPKKNIFIHFWGTITHKFWVAYYIFEIIIELLKRAFLHDLSKFSPNERTAFFQVIHKLKKLTYGSPEYQECLENIKPALDHHYKTNPHHPEHHVDGIEGFSLIDLIEMYCDWRAAVRRHDNGDIYRSIKVNKDRFKMSDQICSVLRNTLPDK